jgi:uncharacterized membrane protein
MNEPSLAELEELRRRQTRLQLEVSELGEKLTDMERRFLVSVSAPSSEEAKSAHTIAYRLKERVPAAPTAAPVAVPPIISPVIIQPSKPLAVSPGSHRPTLPGIPQPKREPLSPVPEPLSPVLPLDEGQTRAIVLTPNDDARSVAPRPIPASFEMRLGTYWLVRIGIVLVLTALAFFGNYAYQNFVVRLGAGGKLTLLYFASGTLLGLGAWWQRTAAKQALKNYGQVLFAGGLAAVYFTTYAAHYVPNLRVLASPTLAGTLLLAWAAFIVWIANRRQSQVLALFAVGLAYYTSVITRVGDFTLYSNLILACAAVFFLVRNRWATLSVASLVGTYAAYAFWRFLHGSQWRWATPEEGLWKGAIFLMCYWAVFTAAVFVSRNTRIVGENRAGFATLNNGLFFGLFVLTMLQAREGGFWRFAMIYGTVLLGLAVAARRALEDEPITFNSYLTQGLLLVTLGLVTKFAGLQLSLLLAVESVILLTFGQRRKSIVLTTGAYICAAMSVGWGIDGMRQFDRAGMWVGAALGALMLVNGVLSHRASLSPQPADSTLLRPGPSFFSALVLVAWSICAWNNSNRNLFPVVIAAVGALLIFSIYPFRVRELSLFGMLGLGVAQVACLVNLASHPAVPSSSPAAVIAVSMVLLRWRDARSALTLPRAATRFSQGLNSLALVLILFFWLSPKFGGSAWLGISSLIAVVITAYAAMTRVWMLAATGQFFAVIAVVECTRQMLSDHPAWHLALAPVALLWVLALAAFYWFEFNPESPESVRTPLLGAAAAYQWAGLLLFLGWTQEFIPLRHHFSFLILLGSLVFLLGGGIRSSKALLFAYALDVAGLITFWVRVSLPDVASVANLFAILALIAQQRFARRFPDSFPLEPGAHNAFIVVSTMTLWAFVSRSVFMSSGGLYLTAAWSGLALALFVFGIALRERMYRWSGLGMLACALGRIIIFDVWKLDVLGRILSFLTLGVALLVLGFIYNKYQEKIKEWL